MQITVIKKNRLNTFDLPKKIEGNYWITDFENGRKINLINIEAIDNKWHVISNPDAFIVNKNNQIIPNVSLEEYNFYLLNNNRKKEQYYIYVSPANDKTYKEYIINENFAIKVGSGDDCQISCKMPGIPENSFVIKKQNNHYYLTVLDARASVYVNKKRVLSYKEICFGDMIFLFGLKMILMKKNIEDYFLVNNPQGKLARSSDFRVISLQKDSFVDDKSELTDESTYKLIDYFNRTPYFYKTIETYTVNLDAPPAKKDNNKGSWILTVGPMMTMSMTSVISLINGINAYNNGSSNGISSMVMASAMLASCLLWPSLTKVYQKKADKKYEAERQEKYQAYINKTEEEIANEMNNQKWAIINNNFSIQECQDVIIKKGTKLWQRRITDDEFLNIPVGYGNVKMKIDIKYPQEHFSLLEDDLLQLAYDLGKKEREILDTPVCYSFYDNIITGIIGDKVVTKDFVDRLVLQIIASYSYDEVKIVNLTSYDNEDDWEYFKILPYCYSNNESIRYFGTSNDDYKEILYNLESIYKFRKEKDKTDKKDVPHYVIITDAIKSVEEYELIKSLLEDDKNYGFSLILVVDKLNALPNECKNFINVAKDECAIFKNIINEDTQKFIIDSTPIYDIYEISKVLANLPIDIKTETEERLPDLYHFLEMYQVGKVEQLNVLDKWRKNNPILSLQAPVGIGKSGELITLDLHEKYHGPHGLIAGTTGSGKSEFIITYILSLAVNFHPSEVQIILIDYKGGSLAGAFANDVYKLPHLAGTITNLDGNELNRSLASIESEVKRRQHEFNNAKQITGESNIDIYKYQKLVRSGRIKEPIAHLFIVSDEFAELKEQQPEFMDKLISIARVGRSLGIHLILATQKPGGVVDSQIWSNSRFKVCLKVQDSGDSQEVLRKPDAAYLKNTGRFYLQVGYDEVYLLAQSAWTGGEYYPSASFKKEVDTSVNEINNIGYVINTKDVEYTTSKKSLGEELPNIVKYLSEVALNNEIKIRKLWLDKIPIKIFVDALKEKYHFDKKSFYIKPIIGEYDDPDMQSQYPLELNLSEHGHAAVYGVAGSGKEMFLSTVIYSCISTYNPEEVNFYIMDFGSETLRMFENAPHVGDVATINDVEKVNNLFKVIYTEIEKRKSEFSKYGGSYNSYIKLSGKTLPNIVVMINNFDAFVENFEALYDSLNQIIRDSFKYGIYFVISSTSIGGIRSKTRQNIAMHYVLQQNDDSEYSTLLGNCRGKIPQKIKGRGLFKKGKILEFQTAMAADGDINSFIKQYVENLENSEYRAPKIPVLPSKVDFNFVQKYVGNNATAVVGVNKNNLNIEKYNLAKNIFNIISAEDLELTTKFVKAFTKQILYQRYYSVLFVNASDIHVEDTDINKVTYKQNYDELFTKLDSYVNSVYEIYSKNDFSDEVIKKQKKIMCVIFGFSNFIKKLSPDNLKKFNNFMKNNVQMNLVSFVIIDVANNIRNYAYEDWFKAGTDASRGIWIGNGIADQSLLKYSKITREDRAEITNEYGFILNMGKLDKIKLLSTFNYDIDEL